MAFEGIRITDALQGGLIIAPTKKEIFKSEDAISSGSSLVVKIPMTHSGIMTRNKGFYLPARMESGAKTFTEGFEKPVIIGHGSSGFFTSSEEPVPIGRVKQANYIDTSTDLLKSDAKMAVLYKQHYSKDQEESLAGGVGLANHIVKKYFKDGNPKKGYQGLGFIEGILNIPDQDAAQKILDGRFLTVSVSVTAKDAFCTACSRNLVKDGMCDHRRGDMVDGLPAMVILGDMNYEHLAIVNSPADPWAAKFELFGEGDSAELEAANDALNGEALKVATNCFIYYNQDNIQSLETDEDINIVQLNDATGGVISAMKGTKKTKKSDPVEPQATVDNAVDPAAIQPPAPAEVLEVKDDLLPFVTLLKDNKLDIPVADLRFAAEFFKLALEKDSDALSTLGIKEGETYVEDKLSDYLKSFKEFYDNLIPYEDLVGDNNYKYFEELLDQDNKDAKLSPEARSKLPSSAFCGPNKSFPVPDCAHATAALRLLNRAKASQETKNRIKTCVNRKSKSMNCSTTKSDSVVLDSPNTPCDNKDQNQPLMKLSESDLRTRIKELRDELINRGLSDDSGQEYKAQVEILDSQLEAAYEEIDELVSSRAEVDKEFKHLLAEKVVDLKILSGDNIEDKEVALEEHQGRTFDSLKDSLKDLRDKVDLKDIAARVNDGTSREPTGQVENPGIVDNTPESNPRSGNSKEEKQKQMDKQAIYDAYDYHLKRNGKKYADAYIQNCKDKGLI